MSFGIRLRRSTLILLRPLSSYSRHTRCLTTHTAPSTATTRLRNFALGSTLLVLLASAYVYTTDVRAGLHRFVVPLAIRMAYYDDAEGAHHFGTSALRALYTLGLHPRERGPQDINDKLVIEVFGHSLVNPIGISAGLDKHAEIPDALLALGPAVVEVGGVTARPQVGNPQPRVFRIDSQNGIVNRYGLNSEGADRVALRLRRRVREYALANGLGVGEKAEQFVLDGAAGVPPGSLFPGRLLAVQIAKNKATPDDDLNAVIYDHVYCVERLGRYADILVVNVSSPNTPGLRSLQSREPLTQILTAVVKAAKEVPRRTKPAVMVKVSPDEDSEVEVQGICKALWAADVDGVIVGNTTMRRPQPIPEGFVLSQKEAMLLRESGGYSGPQLFDRTVKLVRSYRKILDLGPNKESDGGFDTETVTNELTVNYDLETGLEGTSLEVAEDMGNALAEKTRMINTQKGGPGSKKVALLPKTIFASGGITNGRQALEVLNAGANIAMVYTAMVYSGVGTVGRLKQEMKDEIDQKSRKEEYIM